MKAHEILFPNRLLQRGDISRVPDWALAEAGIDLLISLAPREVPCFCHVTHHIHNPIPDGARIPAELYRLSILATQYIQEDKRVLITCNAGRNRSSLLSALILMRHLGLTGPQAVEYVRERRPRALANEHFVEFLTDR